MQRLNRKTRRSGISLSEREAALVKGMLLRGDRQHDIAAWFSVNGGRIAEISTGAEFASVLPAPAHELPPPGPYLPARLMAEVAALREVIKGR